MQNDFARAPRRADGWRIDAGTTLDRWKVVRDGRCSVYVRQGARTRRGVLRYGRWGWVAGGPPPARGLATSPGRNRGRNLRRGRICRIWSFDHWSI